MNDNNLNGDTLIASSEKDIMLVEGRFDHDYIRSALEYYGSSYPEFDFQIISCGGCDNMVHLLEKSIIPTLRKSQLCLCVFDDDYQGRQSFNAAYEIISKKNIEMVDCMVYPKHSGFTNNGSDFMIEDYFPMEFYADEILKEFQKATAFKQFDSLPKAKKIIERNHVRFPKEAYTHFQVFFETAVNRKKAFRKTLKVEAITKFPISSSFQNSEVSSESAGYLNDVSLNASLTAQLLIKLVEITAEYYEETTWEKRHKALQKLFGYERLASYRVVEEMLYFLEDLSHMVRGGMPRKITHTIESLVIHYFHYGGKEERQTTLGEICCRIGFGIAYDAFVHNDDYDVALDGLSILKLCHGKGIGSKNRELEKEAFGQFDHVLSSLVRPERPKLMDAHVFVSFMKEEWLKEVGNLTLPIYPPEVRKVVNANHERVRAKSKKGDW